MSVYLAIPSKRPLSECGPILNKWRLQGYKLALFRDVGEEIPCDILLTGKYQGYGHAINALAREVFARDPDADWIVTGGDDTEPDPNHRADEIAAQCCEHFRRMNGYLGSLSTPKSNLDHWESSTFGVMQPTGDGHGIEHICGSPWLGREFCQRMYGGHGPYWEEYRHMFDDQELQEVAKKLGVLWQRADLRHKHHHWTWTTGICPAFLVEANSRAHWDRNMLLFGRRRSEGFPGHEPLSIGATKAA